jgi:hypothetical protein
MNLRVTINEGLQDSVRLMWPKLRSCRRRRPRASDTKGDHDVKNAARLPNNRFSIALIVLLHSIRIRGGLLRWIESFLE